MLSLSALRQPDGLWWRQQAGRERRGTVRAVQLNRHQRPPGSVGQLHPSELVSLLGLLDAQATGPRLESNGTHVHLWRDRARIEGKKGEESRPRWIKDPYGPVLGHPPQTGLWATPFLNSSIDRFVRRHTNTILEHMYERAGVLRP